MAKKKKATAPAGTKWEILAGDFIDENNVRVTFERGKRTFFYSPLPLDEFPFGPEKFRRVDEDVMEDTDGQEPQTMEAKEDTAVASSPKTEEPEGEDVTDEFPAAEKAALKVYHSDGKYYVYDANNLTVPLHNDELTSKTATKKKIAEFGAD